MAFFCSSPAWAQIDPVRRQLIQIGYNGAFEGHPPLSAYAFYYWNEPYIWYTNWTLRVALAPTYVDSELGISHILGENTDLGIGLAGGGFADSYYEIDQGTYVMNQSFDGHGGELNMSVYHLFNPGQMIPLNGMLRGIAHYSTYSSTEDTAPNFFVPENRGTFSVRTGLRFGGREPTLFPALAMELSVWYQGEFRTTDDSYGYASNPYHVEPHTHLFWAEAYLAYTLPKLRHSFSVSLTAGTSVDPDRFSAYRVGGFLPMGAEYPLSLPGYFYQELSARQFVLINASYILPLEHRHRWNLTATGATSAVDYLPGLEQPGHWNSGLAAGVFYTSASWRVMVSYGYGVDAIRSHGRGANAIGILLQLDLSHAKEAYFEPTPPGRWQGLQRIFSVFGS
jgi:hypothetical protein